MTRLRLASWLRRGAFLLMGLLVAFWLFFGLGEIAGGDVSGIQHLIPAVLLALLGFVAWKRPLVGAAALILLGLCIALFLLLSIGAATGVYLGILLIGAPCVVCGLLLLAAARLTPSPNS